MPWPIQHALDSLASGVIAADLEDRILYVNRTVLRALGVEGEDWIGRPLADLTARIEAHVAQPEVLRARMGAFNAEALQHSSDELEFHRGDRSLHLRQDTCALRDGDGRIAGRLFAFHDISREKEIDRMKTEFISVASHELRTPMTSIKGSIDLVLSGFAGEISTETQELLEIAHKSCDRLIRLINDILDLAKIEAGQIKLKLLRLDLIEVVERSVNGVRSFADQNGVTLRVARPEAVPTVEADKDRIEQVITNLLSNAIKFSPPHGEVVVELTTGDAWVQCSVVDQGCGIAPEDLGKVFGKFQQVGETRRKGGTGLGLAITQALIHEHHGQVWVESALGKGSRFIFRLPVAAGTAAAAASR